MIGGAGFFDAGEVAGLGKAGGLWKAETEGRAGCGRRSEIAGEMDGARLVERRLVGVRGLIGIDQAWV
jgi:hypothetical protein